MGKIYTAVPVYMLIFAQVEFIDSSIAENMEKVFIQLGGNVGNVPENFDLAIKEIKGKIGRVIKQSSRYKTEPWGNKNQDDFLNQVICIETNLTPDEVLEKILAIEKAMGRNRDAEDKFAPRSIDIDILFFGKKIIDNDNLTVPHPRLHLRNFVLTPLMEIAPELVHPVLNEKIKDLFKLNKDTSIVKKYELV
jgi:2-amino-4-hydroxy-6-hydroxymethyldihydropteridine diphosphokinase